MYAAHLLETYVFLLVLYATDVSGALCGAGYYNNWGLNCASCDVGKYQPTTNQDGSCFQCPVGKIASTTGQSVCTDCLAGTIAQFKESSVCTMCRDGKYQPNNGNSECWTCASGKYQPNQVKLFFGLYFAIGNVGCTDCAAGKSSYYMGETDESSCVQCSAGTYAGAGSVACDNCVAGKASATVQATSEATCVTCNAGKYSTVGSGVCTACSTGKYIGTTGASVCSDCSAGSYTASTGQTVCAACGAGTYNPDRTQCTQCGTGTYSNAGWTVCGSCTGGKYIGIIGATACVLCATGTYAASTGASVCAACATGTYFGTTGATACTLCNAGSYSASTGATICTTCPADSYSPASGAASCVSCAFGAYSPAGSSRIFNCTCTNGFAGPSGGPCKLTSMQACPVGRYNSSSTAAGETANMTCSGSCCIGSSGTSGRMSDGIGNYVDNAICGWVVSGVRDVLISLVVSYLSIQNSAGDSLKITSCAASNCVQGTTPVTLTTSISTVSVYTSTTPWMLVTFQTDTSLNGKGFDAQWTVCSLCPTNSYSIQSTSSITDCICNAGFSGPNGGPCVATTCLSGFGYVGRQPAQVTCSNTGCPCVPSSGAISGTICPIDCSLYNTTRNPSFLKANDPLGVILAPTYLSNSICSWVVNSTGGVLVSFPYFATYNSNDAVTVSSTGTGNRVLFSDKAQVQVNQMYYETLYQPLLSTSQLASAGSMQLQFRSDTSNQETGFIAQWSTAVVCASCVAGKYKLSISNDNCTDCGSRTYSSMVGLKVTCSSCPPNSGAACTVCTTVADCLCDGGYWGLSASACIACVTGTYKQTQGLASIGACVKCGVGKYAPTVGATACLSCDAGKITTLNGSSACTLCDVGSTSSLARTECVVCPDGTQVNVNRTCTPCSKGEYSNINTDRKCEPCPPGLFTTTTGTPKCQSCAACTDGYYRTNCSVTVGGGKCMPCPTCGDGEVRVGCMNRAGNTEGSGTCRLRKYLARTPLCDQKNSGYGLGGYTFLQLFGNTQDDSTFQCRRRCDNEQNIMSEDVYTDPATFMELSASFPNSIVSGKSVPQAFNGGYCNGPFACDVSNCNIAGSADDSQTTYQLKFACPLYIDTATTDEFWTALARDPTGTKYDVISRVIAMQQTKCQTCDACGQAAAAMADWGRGCARDCTQLLCSVGLIFDWTEADPSAKCKACGDLDDVRLCLSSEQSVFEGLDVSGMLPKFYNRACMPKRENPPRAYESSYGNCVQCKDSEAACVLQDTYYHSCAEILSDIVPTCKSCSKVSGREPTGSRYWNGTMYLRLACQQRRCALWDGNIYTGVDVQRAPHRICRERCVARVCGADPSIIKLPCVLPHQERCKDAINMNTLVMDVSYVSVGHTVAHANVLEPATDALFLFANFENLLVSTHADQLDLRAQCVWNADFIPDNSMNAAGISSRFQPDCRSWARNPRTLYPLLPLQNTVAPDAADDAAFARRVLLNTTAYAVAYAAEKVPRPSNVFAGDIYLELDLLNTNNATLAAFVPDDRMIATVTWVPRWRVSVHARQVSGGSMTITVLPVASSDANCLDCFSLQLLT